jgi:hypothetical protein
MFLYRHTRRIGYLLAPFKPILNASPPQAVMTITPLARITLEYNLISPHQKKKRKRKEKKV